MESFDVIIIGAGSSGVSAALRASDYGAQVCIIEQDSIGGSCHYKTKHSLKLGLSLLKNNESKFKIDGVVDSKQLFFEITNALQSLSNLYEQRLLDSGVAIKKGIGSLISPEIVQVKSIDQTYDLNAKKIIIATGSSPIALPTVPFEEDIIVSFDDIFKNHVAPKRVFLVGSGDISCELSVFYQMLGSKVFLSSSQSRLFPDQDPEIIDALEQSLKHSKVKLLLGKEISSYYKNGGSLDITLSEGIKFQTDKIIINLNRQGNSEYLKCDSLGVRVGINKEVLVNENLETSVPGIFAVGSITGCIRRSGFSEEEGKIAAENALGKSINVNYDLVPLVVFTDPEIASVGCFADQAHYKGFRGVEGCVQLKNLNFSFFCEKNDGFFKIAADARSGIVIGGQIVSPNASQLISLVVLAIRKGIKVGVLASALSSDKSGEIEGIREAARLCRNAIRSVKKVRKSCE